ncbi:class I SAM-dependent methyltransferase [Candidatus Poribacteria bacterium]|nr:class I SAM-dependent methyltransferase [Candidatus Poribacteria bacterium]
MSRCLLCFGNEQKLIYSGYKYAGQEFSYIQCQNCGLLFCDPLPTKDLLAMFYQKSYDYSWFSKREKLKKIQAWHRCKRIKDMIPLHAKVLDVGCGHGFFVAELIKNGFNAYGFDIGKKVISTNTNRLIQGNSLDDVRENDFDFISTWHFLEHVPDPIDELMLIKNKLKNDGKILAAVPNYTCFGQRIKKRKWIWLQQPYVHLWHFNRSNIRILFEHAGFKIERIWTRDAWDAQIYDSLIIYSINALKLIFGQSGKEWFYFEEFIRLIASPVSYLFNPMHKKFGTGSELIVLASPS